jgi:hypothetical protein
MPSDVFAKPVRQRDWHQDCEVEEGPAQEIAPKLKDRQAHAIVFVSHPKEDSERTQARFAALRRAYAD